MGPLPSCYPNLPQFISHRIKKSSPNDRVELTVSEPATKRSMRVSLSWSNPSEMWKLEVSSDVRCNALDVNSETAPDALSNLDLADVGVDEVPHVVLVKAALVLLDDRGQEGLDDLDLGALLPVVVHRRDHVPQGRELRIFPFGRTFPFASLPQLEGNFLLALLL